MVLRTLVRMFLRMFQGCSVDAFADATVDAFVDKSEDRNGRLWSKMRTALWTESAACGQNYGQICRHLISCRRICEQKQ